MQAWNQQSAYNLKREFHSLYLKPLEASKSIFLYSSVIVADPISVMSIVLGVIPIMISAAEQDLLFGHSSDTRISCLKFSLINQNLRPTV
jgi:hypothetical protein